MSRDSENLSAPPPGATPDPLAAALAQLEPTPPRLDRDRLMYAAGVESRRGTIRLWQATAGFLAAIGFAAGMAAKSASVVYVDRPASTVPAPDAHGPKDLPNTQR